jgi:hypothetical protein
MLSLTTLRTVSVVLALAAVAVAKPVAAEPLCQKRAAMLELLAKDFSEQPMAVGMETSGGVIELLTSANGSWTLILTLPTGLSCLVATGDDWTAKPEQHAGAPS